MITSSSPGILSNDNYNIEVEVEENANVHITTQGYQRLFTMANAARQSMNVHVANNGSFTFLPHPNVPHEASSFSSLSCAPVSQGPGSSHGNPAGSRWSGSGTGARFRGP